VASAPAAQSELQLSADRAFRGDAGLWNPEQLLVLAASSCQLLSFLALAARARIDVLVYDDDASGEMPQDDAPMCLTAITLRPRIVVAAGTSEQRVRKLVEAAHRKCYIANSLKTRILLEPEIVYAAAR
jgi:organic hydroperoxide reductase OsmC/OhrA